VAEAREAILKAKLESRNLPQDSIRTVPPIPGFAPPAQGCSFSSWSSTNWVVQDNFPKPTFPQEPVLPLSESSDSLARHIVDEVFWREERELERLKRETLERLEREERELERLEREERELERVEKLERAREAKEKAARQLELLELQEVSRDEPEVKVESRMHKGKKKKGKGGQGGLGQTGTHPPTPPSGWPPILDGDV